MCPLRFTALCSVCPLRFAALCLVEVAASALGVLWVYWSVHSVYFKIYCSVLASQATPLTWGAFAKLVKSYLFLGGIASKPTNMECLRQTCQRFLVSRRHSKQPHSHGVPPPNLSKVSCLLGLCRVFQSTGSGFHLLVVVFGVLFRR